MVPGDAVVGVDGAAEAGVPGGRADGGVHQQHRLVVLPHATHVEGVGRRGVGDQRAAHPLPSAAATATTAAEKV